MRQRIIIVSCFAIVACGSGDRGLPQTFEHTVVSAPDTASLGSGPLADAVRRGLAIVEHAPDSLAQHVGSALTCTSCHLNAGRVAGAMPWIGVYGQFPQYRSRSGRVDLVEDRVNDCIERSLNGRALPVDGEDMRAIVAYLSWLSRGTPAGRQPGQGLDSISALAGDSASGASKYLVQCARCHGAGGEGMKASLGPVPAWVGAPGPLWGPRSYNIGAGMARVRALAAFVRRNMPIDVPGSLSEQDAADIAAFIARQPRPDFPRKERDWPKGGEPPDVAYETLFAQKRSPGAR